VVTVGSLVTLSGSHRSVMLNRLVGEGSQGAVYEVTPTDGSAPLALKWYFPHSGTRQQRAALTQLVDRGAPTDRFLWPLELVEGDEESFGYVMALRPDRFAGLTDLLNGQVDVSFSTILRLCLELAGSFLNLHSQGLCYRDISFGNVFFDPKTGVPLICDNDNVGIDGRSPSAVLGTRRFMAPEIVRREAMPSTQTDLFSLAVLLFYILMIDHPLVGRRELEFECWDEQAETVLFGTRPLFVFDPVDHSNEPVAELHQNVLRYWAIYPSFIRDLFLQAFTAGLWDPSARVRESVWRSALARLRNRIVRCVTCNKENFAGPSGSERKCWFCDRAIGDTLWLVIDRQPLALGRGSVVHGHHLRHDYDFDDRIAEVTVHPVRADMLGLRNLTSTDWQAKLPDGDEQPVPPGRSVRIQAGTVLDFGRAVGRIEVFPS
jgi:eukaryotic-like serine/threonine-protein kinase